MFLSEQEQEQEANANEIEYIGIRRRIERRRGRRQRRRDRRRSGRFSEHVDEANHDTIGMIVLDAQGDLACGVTTNGLGNKVPGRVGDSPLPGAGCYVDNFVGGAACTGDGDVMLRFSPAAAAVEHMRQGASPQDACAKSIRKIAFYYPGFRGAMICVNKVGEYGAAAYNFDSFGFSVQNPSMDDVQEVDVQPLSPTMAEESAAAAAMRTS
jgi:isoaspartyl peptidase/L-asparaginase-like protein (Ntn-hydrolase superfamily)